MFAWLLVFGIFIYMTRPTHKWANLDGIPLLDVPTCTAFLLIVWILGWFLNPKAKHIQGNILMLAFLFYTIVIIVSTVVSSYIGFLESYRSQSWTNYMLFFVLLVTSVKTERDLKLVATACSVCFFLEMLHIYWTGQTFHSVGVMRFTPGSESRFANVNQLGAAVIILLPLIFPVVTLCKKYWHYLFVLGYVLLTVRLVTMTGSRTAFIMLIALVILPVLFSRYRFRILLLLLLALPVGWFALPEDMQNRYRTLWDPTVNQTANVTREARVMGFRHGMENWMTHPIFGTGAGGGPRAPLADGSISFLAYFQGGAHNLAGQVAGEMGTLGITTFLFMLFCFGINHYKIWKNYQYLQGKNLGKEGLYTFRVSIAVMFGVLMLLLMGLGENSALRTEWIWFGAFQILAVRIMQEKVTAAMQGKLLPSLPMKN